MLETTTWFPWKDFLPATTTLSSLLEAAFKQNLRRSTGWDLRGISNQALCELLIRGAKIYKRGVSWKTEEGVFQEPLNFKSTPIIYVDTVKNLLTALPNNAIFFIDRVLLSLYPNLEALPCIIPLDISEHHKSLSSVQKILEQTRHLKTQNWIAMGGGILTDMIGFAASLAKVPLTLVPTTLLGMVDASLGGKTGVNFPPYGKNQVGSFYFPEKIFICTEWLDTLSSIELLCGGAECIKHMMLDSDLCTFFKFFEACNVFKNLNRSHIKTLVPHWIKTKEKIVEKDPREKGIRASLNLGHTLAHALEALSQETYNKNPIPHGIAVGHGLIFSVLLSIEEGLMEKSYGEKITETLVAVFNTEETTLEKYGLIPAEIWPSLIKFILHDKKINHEDHTRTPFILLKEIGYLASQPEKNIYTYPVPLSTLEKVWKKTCALQAN